MIRICFVCLGNICRSPTAEAVMQRLIETEDLTDRIQLDSAGTGAWHAGHAADPRSRQAGTQRGYNLSSIARQVTRDDFESFDYIVAMDRQNRDDLLALAPSKDLQAKVHLLRSFDPNAPPEAEVPDPYYGGDDGFAKVLDICEAGCEGLLAHIRRHDLS
ncbi:MAG: low molecular weight phosphotyrosine protein phosphatase [Myxococcales bacterium]|nr:low molecular weight phosphotyrosine protein phosphatase [Myxococcales bacterium]